MAQDPYGDRLLEWSKRDAAALKRKLEFHEGTPREIAAEAQKLAKNPYAALANSGWITPEPTSWNLAHPSSSSNEQANFKMSNYI